MDGEAGFIDRRGERYKLKRTNWYWLRRETEWRLQAVGIKRWGKMYLIGSRAGGKANSHSDWDVAVIVPPEYRTTEKQALLDSMAEEEYLEDEDDHSRANVIDIFLLSQNEIRLPYIEWPHL